MICHAFHDAHLLDLALSVPTSGRTLDNQRLEFLGDAVLEILTSERLYRLYPNDQEGALTDKRLHLVSGKSLAAFSQRIDLRTAIQAANPGLKTIPDKMCADAFEAFFGAVWLDGGYAAAKACFDSLFKDQDFAALAHCTGIADNPKGLLQQYAQAQHGPAPVYTELRREGPAHLPHFTVAVHLGEASATGEGSSLRDAEQAAAKQLLLGLTHE